MQRERVSDNVFWFQSEIYAQVTAGVITGPQWAVVIDTLAIPEETIAMRSFVEDELNVQVRYIINTHYHADHTWGNYLFPGATILSHSLCRQMMQERGPAALEAARRSNPAFRPVKLVMPHLTFDEGEIALRIGKKTLVLLPTPGHSRDGISVLVEEDRILFAGDSFLPIPYVVDGEIDELGETIKRIGKMGLENIIQGHGDIILRGEIDDAVKENTAYLSNLRKAVRAAAKRRNPQEALTAIDVESCGKSRVYLSGLAEDLHRRNVRYLYKHLAAEIGEHSQDATPRSEEDHDL